MPLDLSAAESAFLFGKAFFEDWKQKFEGNWYKPLGIMQLGMLMASLPAEEKARLKELIPDDMENIEQLMQRLSGGE